jgi:hypothetical protein
MKYVPLSETLDFSETDSIFAPAEDVFADATE